MLVIRNNWIFLFIIGLFFLTQIPLPVHSQNRQYHFEHLTSDQGLSQNRVYAIHQDRTGYMWFGTYDGLNRYDGYNFKIFRNNPFDSTTIADNEVNVIYEDKAGNLWFGAGGLNRYDPATETFQRFIHDTENPNSLSDNNISSICEDHKGILWIGTLKGGLNKLSFPQKSKKQNSTKIDTNINDNEYNYFNPTFTHFKHDPNNPLSLSHNRVNSILEDTNSMLWIGTENGLNRIDLKADNIQENGLSCNILNPVTSQQIRNKEITSLYQDSEGILWIGTPDGLIKYENLKGSFTLYSFDRIHDLPNWQWRINSIKKITDEEMWLSTLKGVIVFNPRTEQYQLLTENMDNQQSLSSHNVLSLFLDRGGVMWLGTSGRGIDKFNTKGKIFHYYSCQTENRKMSSIRNILQDGTGQLWVVNSEHKLYTLDRNNSNLTQFIFNDPLHNYVYDIMEDKDGLLWFGMLNTLCRYNPKNKQTKYYIIDTDNQKKVNNYNALKIFKDKNNDMWVVTFNRLSHFDRENQTFIHYIIPNNKMNMIYDVYPDIDNIFWFATDNGLWRFNLIQQTWKFYYNDSKNSKSLSNNTIFSILTDPRNSDRYLWLGTAGGGLNRFDKKTDEFIFYCKENGLPNNFIYGILADKENNLWLSTNHGLSRFNPQNETFRNYDFFDGLQNNEFNSQSYFKSANGEMFFGGINGITTFFPEEITDNLHIPPIMISKLKLFHKTVSFKDTGSPLRQPIYRAKEITLPYNQNNISFEFSALDYTAPEKNNYAYKMENFDDVWIHIGNNREAHYSNLPPGEFVFIANGSNNDGSWNETGASLKIIITPPFWKTWWAYLLYFFSFIAVLYMARRYELNRIRLKNKLQYEKLKTKKLNEINLLKSGFFADISHEFRTPLTLIIGPVEQLMLDIKEGKKWHTLSLVKRNALRLLKLINQLLDLSRSEAGEIKLNIAPGNIVEFIQIIAEQFVSLAKSRRISLNFSTEKENIELYFDREIMDKIIVNLLFNAIKFTQQDGSVTVEISSKSGVSNKKLLSSVSAAPMDFMEIKITDTGIGISEDSLPFIFNRFYQIETKGKNIGSGIGLTLVKDLVELHHGLISVESKEGRYTIFTLLFPMGREHFKENELNYNSELSKTDMGTDMEIAIRDELILAPDNISQLSGYSEILDHSKTIILVIEDHHDLRSYIRECLESTYKVIETENGRQGIEKAFEVIPDLIISDVMMPEMDGYQVTKALKKDERSCHIPIVLLTAKATTEEKIEGLETGADAYLLKPFHARELMVRIKYLIETRRRLQERFKKTITIKPSEIVVNSLDEIFMKKILASIEKHIDDENYGVEILADEIGISPSQIYRKIHALTNQSTTQIIQSVRLDRAATLLKQKSGNISEIAYNVGFSSPAYFSKVFREKYNCTPQDYIKK